MKGKNIFQEKETHKYDDIIHLPHHVSTKHPQMALSDRAAQFSPFAALTGHEDSIRETARRTEAFLELDEDKKEQLDEKMHVLQEYFSEKPEIMVTYFVPDENLGRFVAKQLPEKEFIFHPGYCPIHAALCKEDMEQAKAKHPNAPVLAHPECREEVLQRADYVGSTSGIIEFATKSENSEFIICTELGVLYELKQKNPSKRFFVAKENQICADMKRITPEKIKQCLTEMAPQVEMEPELCRGALCALKKMHEMAR